MNATEVADILGVNERSIRRAIAQGRLYAVKRGGRFDIDLEAARGVIRTRRAALEGDSELRAIRVVSEQLEPLPQDVRDRVLRWAVDKFDAAIA